MRMTGCGRSSLSGKGPGSDWPAVAGSAASYCGESLPELTAVLRSREARRPGGPGARRSRMLNPGTVKLSLGFPGTGAAAVPGWHGKMPNIMRY